MLPGTLYCQEETLEVLKISNVPFPSSSDWAATINASHHKAIPEFTLCYRVLIDFNNPGQIPLVRSFWVGMEQVWDARPYVEMLWIDSGFEVDGYQYKMMWFDRNIPGGGIGNRSMPIEIKINLPRTIDISKWYSFCTSYSSIKHHIHSYQDGLQAVNYTYTDPVEDPLRSNIFESVKIGQSLRGMFTDLQIYSSYFTEEAMINWTRGCQQKSGDIFSWDPKKLNITQEEGSSIDVSFVTIDKVSICLDLKQEVEREKPVKSAAITKRRRFKPRSEGHLSVLQSVPLLITDPNGKSALEAKDRCFRLSGEMMTIPQSEEENRMMDKILWDYMRKKTSNDEQFLIERKKIHDIWVASETKLWKDDGLNEHEQVYPEGGYENLYHSITGAMLKPYKMLIPQHAIEPRNAKFARNQCQVCFNSLRTPYPDSFFFGKNETHCHNTACTQLRGNSMICLFKKQPVFTVRGLCKDAVMDTQYKFADHKPMDIEADLSFSEWGADDSRGFVGPKGWTITRNTTTKRWVMSHYHYHHLSLTMVDAHALPVGRHRWTVENNVCNEGKTSVQLLQISGCKEGEFTCDDGKCLDIGQRCNNIEVTSWG